MASDVPGDRRYLETHEWVHRDGDRARIGITDFAQDELGDVVFVELPATDEELVQGDRFGVIESIKAVSDLYAPVSGRVVDVNETLSNAPELVNEDPYGDGWMIEVEVSDPDDFDELLSADEYEAQVQ